MDPCADRYQPTLCVLRRVITRGDLLIRGDASVYLTIFPKPQRENYIPENHTKYEVHNIECDKC